MQIYHASEVTAFACFFYTPPERQPLADHAHIQRRLQPAVDRFKALSRRRQKAKSRDGLNSYVARYHFLHQIVPYSDQDIARPYSYGKCLLPHLPPGGDTAPVHLGDNVALQFYRLQRIHSGEIHVAEGSAEGVKSPTRVGTGTAKDEAAPLSEIIKILNERFGTQFTTEDRLLFEQIKEKARNDPQVIETALANPYDKFALGIRKMIETLFVERHADNDRIVTRYLDDQDFQSAAFPILAREIFDSVHKEAS